MGERTHAGQPALDARRGAHPGYLDFGKIAASWNTKIPCALKGTQGIKLSRWLKLKARFRDGGIGRRQNSSRRG